MLLIKLGETTAARRRIPFRCVDATDLSTAETGLTFSAGDLKISLNGAAEANHNGTAGELGGGLYYYETSEAETNTRGFLSVRVNKTGVAPAVFVAQVIDNDPHGNVKANVMAIAGGSANATRLALATGEMVPGTVDTDAFTATTTAFEALAAEITEETADHYNGRTILFTSGVLKGQATTISDYAWSVNSKPRFTVAALTEAPGNSDYFLIV